MDLKTGWRKVYRDLEFEGEAPEDLLEKDRIGGYPEKWEVGSIWEVEGKLLYGIVRTLKPRRVVEFGTRYGCSTAHILQAMDDNGVGELWTVDNGANGLMDVEKHPRLHQLFGDGLKIADEWDGRRKVDMVFEDGPHSPEFTYGVIIYMLRVLRSGAVVCVHDTEHFLVGEDVTQGFKDAVRNFDSVLIEPSDCGLGYWRNL